MATNIILVIPHRIGMVMWEVMEGIKRQTFQDFTMEIVDNERMKLPPKKIQTKGHAAVTYIYQNYKPDFIIFHPADTIMRDDTILQRMYDIMQDKTVIGCGIRPRSRQGGNWHLANYNDIIHWSGFLSIYSKEVYPYVDKILISAPNTDVWHEACYYAIEEKGYKFLPVWGNVTYTGEH